MMSILLLSMTLQLMVLPLHWIHQSEIICRMARRKFIFQLALDSGWPLFSGFQFFSLAGFTFPSGLVPPLRPLSPPSFVDVLPVALALSHPSNHLSPRNSLVWLIVVCGHPTAYGLPSYLIMDPPDPPANFLPLHVGFQVTHWDGTVPNASAISAGHVIQSGCALGGIPSGQRAALLAAI